MLENQTVYQVFLRNYSQEGTFKSLENDLDRIQALGVDIIYLTPIHPISKKARKGTWGSPYANANYLAIDSSLGDESDFVRLINEVHRRGMKLIIDMVFNHTGRDNVLLDTHPEYYFYRDGKLGNRVGDWSDVVDLDTHRDDTQEYLVSVLAHYAHLGVDGYRFDVSSMIPLSLFQRARKTLGDNLIFIGESIDYDFSEYLRSQGEDPIMDGDAFPTFNALYNYSWFKHFDKFLQGKGTIDDVVDALNADAVLLDHKGLRMNCLENHDVARIAGKVKGEELFTVIDFITDIRGMLFIYMGQEYGADHLPELFEKDPVNWVVNEEIYDHYKEAVERKKHQPVGVFQKFEKVDDRSIRIITYLEGKIIRDNTFHF